MARCVIVSACEVPAAMAGLLRGGDFIIACDAGYRNCRRLGVQPHIIVGDFDSAPQPRAQGVVVLPHVKDDTDTEYAARLAVQRGFTEVLLLGALGGSRIEHTLANIATGLGLAKQGVQAALCSEHSRLSYVLPGQPRSYPKGEYFYLSVFPLEGESRGVEIEGAFYPLHKAALAPAYPLGVSNEYAPNSSCITVSCAAGALLVVETRADGCVNP